MQREKNSMPIDDRFDELIDQIIKLHSPPEDVVNWLKCTEGNASDIIPVHTVFEIKRMLYELWQNDEKVRLIPYIMTALSAISRDETNYYQLETIEMLYNYTL